MMDLFIGYNHCMLNLRSRNLTTCQTPMGAMCLTLLPMGWTNSIQVFQGEMAFILQDEYQICANFVDNVPVMGPTTRYETENGGLKWSLITQGFSFIWEHVVDVVRRPASTAMERGHSVTESTWPRQHDQWQSARDCEGKCGAQCAGSGAQVIRTPHHTHFYTYLNTQCSCIITRATYFKWCWPRHTYGQTNLKSPNLSQFLLGCTEQSNYNVNRIMHRIRHAGGIISSDTLLQFFMETNCDFEASLGNIS